MSTMPSYLDSRINETLILISENLLQLENNIVIRFGSSATILKLITVRDILQQVVIFIFIKGRNWVLITSEHTLKTIALLFGSTLKLSAGFRTIPTEGKEGRQNIIKSFTTYLKVVIKFTNDIKLN